MAKEINLPGIGKVKTGYVIAAGSAVVVIVGYAYIRHRNSAASAASSTGTSGDTGSAAVDPQTGYPYGSPEDTAALAQLASGDSSYYGGYPGGATGGELYYDPATGQYDLTSPYNPSSSSTANTGPGTFTEDAYWTQYCIENVTGYSASQIQGAIAAVFAGQGLTETQMSIWQACLAIGGAPPTAPGTAPHLGSGGGGGSAGKYATDPPPGFGVSKSTKNSATFHWTKQGTPLTGYEFTLYSGATEISSQAPGASVTSLTVNGLKPSYKYVAKLRALPQRPGSDGASVSFTTPK